MQSLELLGAAAATADAASPGASDDESDSSEAESEDPDGPRSSGSDEVSSSERVGCASASDGSDYESARSDGDAEAEAPVEAAAAPSDVGQRVEPAKSLRQRLAGLGFSFRPPVAQAGTPPAFREREAQKRDARQRREAEDKENAQPSGGAAATAAALQLAAPVAPEATSSSSSTPSTDGYSLPLPPQPPLLVAPEGPELEAQVAELMRKDPAAGVRLAMAIFRYLPTRALAEEYERVLGKAPSMLNKSGAHVERSPMQGASASPHASAGPASLGVMPVHGAVNATPTDWKRCMLCDPIPGSPRAVGQTCAALLVFDSRLEDDLVARDAIVEQELADGCDEEPTQRGARWFMYRTYVAYRFGYLGPGVRVRIPNCVIAVIRMRYRAPGCTCNASEILTCSKYRGHRDS